jgi:hypothetical protein
MVNLPSKNLLIFSKSPACGALAVLSIVAALTCI